jgi:hypothetical protein
METLLALDMNRVNGAAVVAPARFVGRGANDEIDQIQFRPTPGGMPGPMATRTIELAGQHLLPALS